MGSNQNLIPMLEIVIMLVIIALVLLFLRAGRQNTIVYRKKVAQPDRDRGYSIDDQPSASSSYYTDNESRTGHGISEPLAFGGGEFGGGGAGDSYNIAAGDPAGNGSSISDAFGSDLNGFYFNGSSDSASNDCDSYDPGSTDSDSSDSSSDSGSDSSGSCFD